MVAPRYQSHVRGNGPIVIELWVDYICPFSKKLFQTLNDEVVPAAEMAHPGKLQWVFRHQTQPWHPQGGWLHEVGIAVGFVAPDKFWSFSAALYKVQSKFFDEVTTDKSRNDIIAAASEIAASVGVSKDAVVDAVRITPGEPKNAGSPVITDVKYYARLGRQNGIHVTPTVVAVGVVDNEISSSWTPEQWLEKLNSLVLSSSTTRL